jgi:hypothetical protein
MLMMTHRPGLIMCADLTQALKAKFHVICLLATWAGFMILCLMGVIYGSTELSLMSNVPAQDG